MTALLNMRREANSYGVISQGSRHRSKTVNQPADNGGAENTARESTGLEDDAPNERISLDVC